MRRWLPFICVFIVMLSLTQLGLASNPPPEVTPEQVEYTFGGQAIIRARIQSVEPISEVQVFLRNPGETDTIVGDATISDSQIIYTHTLSTQPLRAFSTIDYWFRIVPQTGNPSNSDVFSFYYEDNRFDWQTLNDGLFTVHWYEGDVSFAQSVLDNAKAGLERAQSLLPFTEIQPVNIYVYASGLDMQSTLRLGGLRWIAGHADPDLGVMVVSLPAGPDQHRETERQIPHELMHLLLYQYIGKVYYDLPIWLKEGLASANELHPNPDYYTILTSAMQKGTPIPLSSFCQSFPQDSTIYLAYAESDSFTRYLYQIYGSAGLDALVKSYVQGSGCVNGPAIALGKPLDKLEQDWRRETFGENALLSAMGNLLPWVIILVIVLAAPLILTLGSLRRNKKVSLSAGQKKPVLQGK